MGDERKTDCCLARFRLCPVRTILVPGSGLGETGVRAILATCAIALAIVAVAFGIIHYSVRAHEFKVAIPASNALDLRVFGMAAESLRTQRAPIRIEVVTADNTKAALDLLEAGKVKLAVV